MEVVSQRALVAVVRYAFFQQAFSLLGRRMEVGSADGCLEIKAALVSQPHLRRVFRACGAGSVS